MDHEVILEDIALIKMVLLEMYFKILDILDELMLLHLSISKKTFFRIFIIFNNFILKYKNLFNILNKNKIKK